MGTFLSSQPVTVANDMVYVGSSDCNIYALDAATGEKIWNFITAYQIQASPNFADGVVYIGSNDGNVYALKAASGTKIWNYSTGSSIRAATGIARGVLYVGAANGKVYAIGTPQQIISLTPSPTPNGATPTPNQTTSPTT